MADFRPRDMAAGGLGAPLAPYGHHLLFADPHRPKLVQNIGGIANVTVLADADMHGLLAFDTGPGNMLIDEALRYFSGGQQHYDAGGQMAARVGAARDATAHLYHAIPPKATGARCLARHLCGRCSSAPVPVSASSARARPSPPHLSSTTITVSSGHAGPSLRSLSVEGASTTPS